jgi:uncharacterized protein DUF6815
MPRPRVGLLWRAEWDPPGAAGPVREECRLRGVFAAFEALGVRAEPIVYSDESLDDVREQLLALDGVLVWVNPIEQGRDRSQLDALLRTVADAGVWVSAHPDVIAKMATKTVLVDTRDLSWGTDTRLYSSAAQLAGELPGRLAGGARVLKRQRGMGGQGVWKVELDGGGDDPWVRVQEATRGAPVERLQLSAFVARCAPCFDDGATMVEQPFQERIAEGMVRAYLTHDKVVGFAHQYPAGLRPAAAGEPPPGKRFELPTASAYQDLREALESTWVRELQQILRIETQVLPVIWDADFLYGDERYVLCEINASSTFAFPEHAMPTVARAALEQIAVR